MKGCIEMRRCALRECFDWGRIPPLFVPQLLVNSNFTKMHYQIAFISDQAGKNGRQTGTHGAYQNS